MEFSLVYQPSPQVVSVHRVPHNTVEDDDIGLEFRISGRHIAEHIVPRERWESVQKSGILDVPRPIGLVCFEYEYAAHAIVVMVLPSRVELPDDEAGNPIWSLGIPEHPNPLLDLVGDVLPFRFFGFASTVRYPSERNHPGDLREEALEMLAAVLRHGTTTPEQEAIRALLDSL